MDFMSPYRFDDDEEDYRDRDIVRYSDFKYEFDENGELKGFRLPGGYYAKIVRMEDIELK